MGRKQKLPAGWRAVHRFNSRHSMMTLLSGRPLDNVYFLPSQLRRLVAGGDLPSASLGGDTMTYTYGGSSKRLPLGNLNGVGLRYKRWAKTMSGNTAQLIAWLFTALFALGVAITLIYGSAEQVDMALQLGLPLVGFAAPAYLLTDNLPFFWVVSRPFPLSVFYFPVGAILWILAVRDCWIAQIVFRQRARDAFAASVFGQLQSGRKPPAFSLYLRPFNFTGQAATADLLAGALQQGAGTASRYLSKIAFDLEAPLMRATAGVAPLVCLGQPLDHIGAGRILVPDEGWKEAIHLLMAQADCIFIIPSTRPGTLWEIDSMVETGTIKKCVFIDLKDSKKAHELFRQEKEWPDIRTSLLAAGFELPDNSKSGSIFAFAGTKQPRFQKKFSRSASAMRNLVRKVLRSAKKEPA